MRLAVPVVYTDPVPTGLWSLEQGVTQSILYTFLTCPEKLRLGAVEGLQREHPTGPIYFGSLVHNALEKVYRSIMAGDCTTVDTTLLRLSAVLLEMEEAERKAVHESSVSNVTALQELEENYGIAEGVLPGYLERWTEDFEQVEWLGLEEEFVFYVTLPSGTAVPVRGKRDGRFRHNRDGSMRLFETKTKGQIFEGAIMDRLGFDDQCMIYLLGMWKEFGEVPGGIVYNIIRKPLLRQKKGETLHQFGKRIREDTRVRPDHYYMRFVQATDKHDLIAYEKDLISKLAQMERWCKGEFHYKNSYACSLGGMNCRFLPICARNDLSGFVRKTTAFPELSEGEATE